MKELYGVHKYVRDGKNMDADDLEYFASVTPNMPNHVAVLALKYLSDYMSRYYGQKVLIFLDEYDTPLQEAYVHGYFRESNEPSESSLSFGECPRPGTSGDGWEELVGFIRSMFNSTFKTNPYLDRAIMTGITRISKESIFSDLNNLTVVTTTSEKYQTQFGFTEEEVFQALDIFGMSEQKEEVKRWYDGFTFGTQKDIYNSWSITNFLEEKVFKPYWANSSSNSLAGKLIREGEAEIKMDMEALLDHQILEKEIDEEIVFNHLDESDVAIWSLLLAAGYLKVEYVPEYRIGGIYGLSLTNYEVEEMFRQMIRGWFGKSSAKYNDFVKALLLNDLRYMNRFMNQMTNAVFSYFDTGRKPSEQEPERFYHGFVLGLIADSKIDYVITSNRESGFGRYDVVMEPKAPGRDAYVFEFKVHDPESEDTLEDTVVAALKQIEEKNYDAALIGKGIPRERIRHYGFAFEGKQVLIG